MNLLKFLTNKPEEPKAELPIEKPVEYFDNLPPKKVAEPEPKKVRLKKESPEALTIDSRVKLDDMQKKFVIKMHASMMSPREIVEAFKERYGLEISFANVYRYKTSLKWSSVISKEREKYLSDMAEVPIFHPRVRFERYENLYNMALKKGDMKGMHDALSLTQSEFGKKVGGDTYNQVFMTNNTVTMSMEEIRARKDKLLNRLHELNPEDTNGPDRPAEENKE